MALNKQADLFLAEPDLMEGRPEQAYRADPDAVRRNLLRLLAEARAAETMPWPPRKAMLYRTIFPQMANWLPEDEAAQLRLQFASELERLKAA